MHWCLTTRRLASRLLLTAPDSRTVYKSCNASTPSPECWPPGRKSKRSMSLEKQNVELWVVPWNCLLVSSWLYVFRAVTYYLSVAGIGMAFVLVLLVQLLTITSAFVLWLLARVPSWNRLHMAQEVWASDASVCHQQILWPCPGHYDRCGTRKMEIFVETLFNRSEHISLTGLSSVITAYITAAVSIH